MMMFRLNLIVALTVVMTYTPVRTAPAWTSDWDFFTFTQSWPPGTCSEGVYDRHICHVGQDIKTWTIHGLCHEKVGHSCLVLGTAARVVVRREHCLTRILEMHQQTVTPPGGLTSVRSKPSVSSGAEPGYCNKSYPFDFSQVASLTSQLNIYWPNMYNDTPHNSFWAHEWEKHGTCASSLPETKGEFNFFNKALSLNTKYSLDSILNRSRVTPSDTKPYHFHDFIDAVKNVTGFEPILECAGQKQEDGTSRSIIYQIEICLNKSFSPVSCGQSRRSKGSNSHNLGSKDSTLYFKPRRSQSTCSPTKAFYYPPIKYV